MDGNEKAVLTQMLQRMQGGDPEGDSTIVLTAEPEHSQNHEPPIPGEVLELDGNFDFDGYQVVRREFFAHTYEPSLTFNNYKVYVNVACLNRFPNNNFVQVLVNQDRRILAIRPCMEEERDAFAWCSSGSGKRRPKQITCKLFFAKVFALMGWNLDYRYKLLGKVIHANGEYLIAFDLTATEIYQRIAKDGSKPKTSRIPVFPDNWKAQFGLPFKEHQKSLQINIFDGYAVYGIKEKAVQKDEHPSTGLSVPGAEASTEYVKEEHGNEQF